MSLAAKKKLTIDEVTENNESKLKKKKSKIIASTKAKKVSTVCAENWGRYIEDIVFVGHLYSMAYINTVKYDSLDFQRKI